MRTREMARTPRMVVGLDGSAASEEALEWVAGQAAMTGATVDVVATWSWPSGYGAALVIPSDYDPAGDAHSLVEAAVARARTCHPGVAFVPVVVEGHPPTVLVDASRGADLLAVGSRGHGGVAGMLLGSVSEHCAAHAHCPVLIVRGAAFGLAADDIARPA